MKSGKTESKKISAKNSFSSFNFYRKNWNDWKGFLILLLVMFSFRSAIADWNDVPTGSMKPTIVEGDRIIVNKLAYDLKFPFTTIKLLQWGNPERGDIVVFYSPVDGTRFIKRVIGIPGDEVALVNNQIILNGKPQGIKQNNSSLNFNLQDIITEENLAGKTHSVMFIPEKESLRYFKSIKIPENNYFVMGDNRDNSFDSRYFGCVRRDSIVGKGTAIAFSLNRAFTLLR